jgi:hypothetical protein
VRQRLAPMVRKWLPSGTRDLLMITPAAEWVQDGPGGGAIFTVEKRHY